MLILFAFEFFCLKVLFHLLTSKFMYFRKVYIPIRIDKCTSERQYKVTELQTKRTRRSRNGTCLRSTLVLVLDVNDYMYINRALCLKRYYILLLKRRYVSKQPSSGDAHNSMSPLVYCEQPSSGTLIIVCLP